MQSGTARKPAARNRASSQPWNFDGTLSNHDPPPGPPEIGLMSLSRNDNSTAFLSHWLTRHSPPIFSAIRASPESSSASAASTASRIGLPVSKPTLSRRSHAASMVLSISLVMVCARLPEMEANDGGAASACQPLSNSLPATAAKSRLGIRQAILVAQSLWRDPYRAILPKGAFRNGTIGGSLQSPAARR